MKFTFPFVSHEPDDEGGTRLNQDMVSVHIRPDSKPRFIKKAIRRVIKHMYGITISQEEAAVYYDVGLSMVRGGMEADKYAQQNDVKLSDEEVRKFVGRRQSIAAERLKNAEK